ncbi:cytochrome c [Falsirhodobacter sp. alg1]|uniref:cytochrome c n=1 Tax=Falsirhodobacter sp. alg1 TaxID=1472418 RepID=UPI0007883316|nr:cytochrome c [Falsirhodobacter sp. alg1]
MTHPPILRMVSALSAFGALAMPLAAETPDTGSGAYIATAADCAACHTAKGGAPFAGGYAINSPMGVITSSNITPSKDFGIGNYTLAEFSDALRKGIRSDGAHLYPAMPYPAYANMGDDDIAALYDYFMHDVAPVEAAAPETSLPFPFSQRWAMIGWNALFAGGDPLEPDPAQSAEWNRGRYLANGPAHCGTCHTPRNFLMGSKTSDLMAGGMVGAWYAPNLTPGRGGLRNWSDADLKSYLGTGVASHARASGPMAEAVEYSLQHLVDDDIDAIVTYLRSLPARDSDTPAAPAATAADTVFAPWARADDRANHRLPADAGGAELYESACASCHGLTGEGSADGTYPALQGNLTLDNGQGANLLSTILHGVTREVDGKHTLMPGFGPDSQVQKLDDTQIAALANYTGQAFGKADGSITAEDVETARTGGPVAPLVRLAAPHIMIAAALAVLLVLALLALWLIRRRAR